MIKHALPRMREWEKKRRKGGWWGDGEIERERKKNPIYFLCIEDWRGGVWGGSKGTDKEMRESTSPRLHLAPEEREENDFKAAALMKESAHKEAAALFHTLQ